MRAMFLALAVSIAACAHGPAQTAANQLTGTEWRRIDDLDANPHGATLAIDGERASGSTGCNRWFGAAQITDDRLTFDSIGTTRMACADVQMATERNFLAILQRVARYRLDDEHTLVVMDSTGNNVARFTRER